MKYDDRTALPSAVRVSEDLEIIRAIRYYTTHGKVTNKRIAVLFRDGSINLGRDFGELCQTDKNVILLLEQKARGMGLRPRWKSRASLLCPDCALPHRQCQCR